MNAHVHYRLTKVWALDEGFTAAEAEAIARGDVGVDRTLNGRAWRNKRFHFRWLGARRWARRFLEEAVRDGDLGMLGAALHCEQDAWGHGHPGHLFHWPGIDIWERRGPQVRLRIERATRALLREYLARRT